MQKFSRYKNTDKSESILNVPPKKVNTEHEQKQSGLYAVQQQAKSFDSN